MKTLERSSNLATFQTEVVRNTFIQSAPAQKSACSQTAKKVAPTTSHLPLNGLNEVTYLTGFGDSEVIPCHTADPDLFFSEATTDINQAKALCGGCPVARQCLEGALSRAEPFGVWGGQLLDNGRVVAAKKRAGRPRIHIQDESQSALKNEPLESIRSLSTMTELIQPDHLESEDSMNQIERLERAS